MRQVQSCHPGSGTEGHEHLALNDGDQLIGRRSVYTWSIVQGPLCLGDQIPCASRASNLVLVADTQMEGAFGFCFIIDNSLLVCQYLARSVSLRPSTLPLHRALPTLLLSSRACSLSYRNPSFPAFPCRRGISNRSHPCSLCFHSCHSNSSNMPFDIFQSAP